MLPYQLKDAIKRKLTLLVPAGCIECHGPHMALGNDTIVVEELCKRIAEKIDCVIAPSFDYGPTGYAVSGPELGTIDVDNDAFYHHVKSVLKAFWEIGFKWIIVIVHHQGMDGPEALAFRKAGAEITFEMVIKERELGWWGNVRPAPDDNVFGRIRVMPSILPAAVPPAGGDHAGYYETSLLLYVRPELVDMQQLRGKVPWYCEESETNRSDLASPEAGKAMMDAMVKVWVNELERLR